MRIKQIEFENFRNFKEKGRIDCSTDGRITIIYGHNGDGKTTLHQLFQWIFYGEVHFNNTTSDILYNLSYAKEQKPYSEFVVRGTIDFIDIGDEYSVTRTAFYKKGASEISKYKEELDVLHCVGDDWRPMDQPQEVINRLIPRGLSEYFFFDGEGMIADLKTKGRDSAKKLKQSLYTMFDLDVIDNAIKHIGNDESKTTVLGTLYLSKGEVITNSDISDIHAKVQSVESKKENIEESIKEKNKQKRELENLINDLSEKIGSAKSDSYYTEQRQKLRDLRDQFLKNKEAAQTSFGEEVVRTYPKLLMAKATDTAKETIRQSFDSDSCPEGLEKKLVEHLLKEGTGYCICGRPFDEESRAHIRHLLQFFQPYSNDASYARFLHEADRIRSRYDKEKLHSIIKNAADNQKYAEDCDQDIQKLDEEQKNDVSIAEYITDRQNAEHDKEAIEIDLDSLGKQLERSRLRLKAVKNKYDQLTKDSESGKHVLRLMEIMEEVKRRLEYKLASESKNYSEKLQQCIQQLMDEMLTSKRKVSVTDEFSVRIVDSFNDESKSEGQFAVISFAYIGGIMKMLKDEMRDNQKEYPLVLDGPFSKLDEEQRQNVIDCLPTFAPQVILFSKDPLNDYFPEGSLGKIWTIQSNEEKNVASVKEEFLWK